jgi:glycosyltransferase involved in cell wall biosynthesis
MKQLRILHAPIEIAGQMGILSKAQRSLGHKSTSVSYYDHLFKYACDKNLRLNSYHIRHGGIIFANIKKLCFFIHALILYNVFHFHFGVTLIYNYLDLPILKFFRKKIVMHFWGDDVRRSEISEANNKYYKLAGYIKDDKKVSDKLRKLSKYVDTVIIPNYELLEHVKNYFNDVKIIRQAINISDYSPKYPEPETCTPFIVHAPSDKDIKGTKFIVKAINRLRDKYIFKFKLVHGISHDEAERIYQSADIIIDQLILGEYGLVSIEAMAFGKPVVCFIRDDIRSLYKDLPIVSATPENIEEKIEWLLKNPQARTELGRAGRSFVEANHDSRTIAKQLIEIYDGI